MKNKGHQFIYLSLLGVLLLTSCGGSSGSSSSASKSSSSASSEIVSLSSEEELSSSESFPSARVGSAYHLTGAFSSGDATPLDFDFVGDFQNFSTYDNGVYHADFAQLGVFLSSNIYDGVTVTLNGVSREKENEKLVFDALEMEDYSFVSLKSEDYEVDPHDITQFQIAHTSYECDGATKEVVFVVVEGTSSEAEWLSNMDIGACDEYFTVTGEHPDYKNLHHHKGFDVAYNRVLPVIDAYLETHGLTGEGNSLFFTGHSRGAGLANMLGAHYEEGGYRTFTYTFASPRVTSKEETTHASVFNIVNEQDFVGALVPEYAGFKRYGNDIFFNTADFKETFQEETHIEYASADVAGLVDEFQKIIPTIPVAYTKIEEEQYETFSTFGKGPLETEEEAQKRCDLMQSFLYGYSSNFYWMNIVKEEDGYYVRSYDCPALVLESLALIISAASSSKWDAGYEIAKATAILPDDQLSLVIYFIGGASGMAANHLPFTYLAGLNHLKSASSVEE